MVETEVGLVDDGAVETEVHLRLPRGSDPGPEGMQKDIPIIKGAVCDTPDTGQPRRFRPWAGPNRNGPQ